jgi:hypothetical protein
VDRRINQSVDTGPVSGCDHPGEDWPGAAWVAAHCGPAQLATDGAEGATVKDKNNRDRNRQDARPDAAGDQRRDERSGRTWADDAADARTSDDPRARTPSDAAGQPSGRPFDE